MQDTLISRIENGSHDGLFGRSKGKQTSLLFLSSPPLSIEEETFMTPSLMHSIQNGFYNGFNHFLFCFSISSIFSPLNWFLIHQASLSYYPRSLYYWRVIIFYSSIVVAKFQQERSATHQEVSPISSLTKFLGQNIWDRETAMEYPKVPPYIHTAKETQRKCCCAIRAASLLLDI